MSLPPLDPAVVQWFNVVSSVVTTAASITAAVVTIKHYFFTIRDTIKERI